MERIGKYEVRKALGRGGLGAVFQAVDPESGLEVAVKTITAATARDPKKRERFSNTARAVAELEHPNIARVLEVGEDQGKPYVVTELVTGVDLAQVIASRREFPIEWSLDVFRQICEGLAHAHRNGILHLDLKPTDLRVTQQQEVKILDFGITHLKSFDRLETGPARGGVFYRAPEQIEGRRPNGRADVFSVGAIVYELITRRKPFPAEDTPTVLFKITHDRVDTKAFPETAFSPGLEAIVLQALARDPRERYRSLEDLHEALVKLVQAAAPRLRALSPPPQPKEAPPEPGPAPREEAPPEPAPAAAPTASPAAPPAETDREKLLEEMTAARAEGNLPRALEICERLLDLDPEDEHLLQAASEIESAIQNREVEHLCSLALGYAADGDVELATKIAEKVERLAPWSPRYLQLQVYLDEERARLDAEPLIAQARGELALGNLESAAAVAEQALGVDPASAPARRILEQVAELREAAPAGGEGLEPEPSLDDEEPPAAAPRPAREAEVESLTSEALNHFVHNDHPRARRAVEEALAIDPRNRRALELLKLLGTLG